LRAPAETSTILWIRDRGGGAPYSGIRRIYGDGAYILFANFLHLFPSVKNVAVFASEVDREAITSTIATKICIACYATQSGSNNGGYTGEGLFIAAASAFENIELASTHSSFIEWSVSVMIAPNTSNQPHRL
jgi:hypothetical protein